MPAHCIARLHIDANAPDLGPGAAVHISDISEPVGAWLKSGGARENSPIQQGTAFPAEVLQAARERRVTGSMLGVYTRPRCSNSNYASHESQLAVSTRDTLRAALPWALRESLTRCVVVVVVAACGMCVL